MRSQTASHPYSRTHATPARGACFGTEEPRIGNTSLAPQHRVQTFIQRCPFTRCFIARPGLILLGLIWASYSLKLTRLDDDSTAFPPNCSRKSLFLLRHWRSLTCSPFSLNNLNKHSVWSFSLRFATHSHSHPLATLTSFGLFPWFQMKSSHFLSRFNAAADPMSQDWWIKPFLFYSVLHCT